MTNATNINRPLILAAAWLDQTEEFLSNTLAYDFDTDRALALREGIAAEDEEFEERASAHATEVTGWTWDIMTAFGDEAMAWQIIHDTKLAALQADARERRLFAYAALLPA